MTDLRDQRTAVYRFFDAEGRLLHVRQATMTTIIIFRWGA